MPVVATAGHVDHGKSTLIEALTGRDPDRFEEEKRRGMTIDLGFAWSELPSGRVISFVDVPGHHRFIRNTLAGLGPVDAALLVVAANEGWMPQTEEHVCVLDLLGVSRGLVAITKTDLVDGERIVELTTEIARRLVETALVGARIVPVAATTGTGLDDLRHALDEIVGEGWDRGRPRLWVDRVFSMPGSGVVVTGTLNGGLLAKDQMIEIWPGPVEARIRRIENNEEEQEQVPPSSRVAINLAGVRQDSIARGAMVCEPGSFRPTRRVLLAMRPTPGESPISRGAHQLHIGTFHVPARLQLLEDDGRLFAVADLEREVCLQAGDRVIIRDTGRQRVVAGGSVLDPAPPRRRGDWAVAARSLVECVDRSPDGVAAALLEVRGIDDVEALAADSGGGQPPGALIADGQALSMAFARSLAARITDGVEAHGRAHPHDPAMGIGELSAALEVTPAVIRELLPLTGLEVAGQTVGLPGHGGRVEANPDWLEARSRLADSGLAPPTIAELALDRDLLATLVREGLLFRISDEFVYLPSQIDHLVDLLAEFDRPFTVSEVRQVAMISRRYAIPLLEWTDREGITTRDGDVRTVRRGFKPDPAPR
ncbi:MAG TPA: selenocysteine-specific translation elongation factor [Acidimicrobiia bacterium]